MSGSAPGLRRVCGFSWDTSATLEGWTMPTSTGNAANVGWRGQGGAWLVANGTRHVPGAYYVLLSLMLGAVL